MSYKNIIMLSKTTNSKSMFFSNFIGIQVDLHPICTFVDLSRAFATRFIVFAYSARNASSTGVNLLK